MPVFNQRETEAAVWLSRNLPNDSIVYADAYGERLLWQVLWGRVGEIPNSAETPDDAYIFLRSWNINKGEINVVRIRGAQRTYEHVPLSDMPVLLEGREVIYDNGGAQVLAPELYTTKECGI